MNQNTLLIMKEIKNQIIYIKLKNNFYKNLQLMILIIRIKINIIKNNHILDYKKDNDFHKWKRYNAFISKLKLKNNLEEIKFDLMKLKINQMKKVIIQKKIKIM